MKNLHDMHLASKSVGKEECVEKTPPYEDSLVLGIGNAGACISIADCGYGPEFTISSSAYDNLRSKISIKTDKESLLDLAKFFFKAHMAHFSEKSSYAAESDRSKALERSKCNCKNKGSTGLIADKD